MRLGSRGNPKNWIKPIPLDIAKHFTILLTGLIEIPANVRAVAFNHHSVPHANANFSGGLGRRRGLAINRALDGAFFWQRAAERSIHRETR